MGQVWMYEAQPVLLPATAMFSLKLQFGERQWPAKGDRVVIPKGTLVFSTYPGWPPEGKPAGRSYEVTVVRVGDRGKEQSWKEPGTRREKTVHWSGSAQYWKWCALAEVERPPSDLERLANVSGKRGKK
jgi:hypothetical protein